KGRPPLRRAAGGGGRAARGGPKGAGGPGPGGGDQGPPPGTPATPANCPAPGRRWRTACRRPAPRGSSSGDQLLESLPSPPPPPPPCCFAAAFCAKYSCNVGTGFSFGRPPSSF